MYLLVIDANVMKKSVRLHVEMQRNRLSNLRKRCNFIYYEEFVKKLSV